MFPRVTLVKDAKTLDLIERAEASARFYKSRMEEECTRFFAERCKRMDAEIQAQRECRLRRLFLEAIRLADCNIAQSAFDCEHIDLYEPATRWKIEQAELIVIALKDAARNELTMPLALATASARAKDA